MTTLADLPEEALEELRKMQRFNHPRTFEEFVDGLYEHLDKIIDEAGRDAPLFYESNGEHTSEDKVSQIIALRLQDMAVGRRVLVRGGERGSVDITAMHDRLAGARWLGEAKISRGPAYLEGGLRQLLTRYADGCASSAGMLIYHFDVNPNNAMTDWGKHLESVKMESARFVSARRDSDRVLTSCHELLAFNREINTRHMIFPYHFRPEDKSGKATRARRASKAAAGKAK